MKLKDYLPENDPTIGQPLERKVEYWKERARFFEERAYILLEKLKNFEDDIDDADWWKD